MATAEQIWVEGGCSTPGCGYPDGKPCINCGLVIRPRCPTCKGESQHPEISECQGCMDCDFTGTREGYDVMQSLEKQSREAPRPELPDEG